MQKNFIQEFLMFGTAFLLLALLFSCAPKPKLYFEGQRSEGMTTGIIKFYNNGTYVIKDKTFLFSNDLIGHYTIQDSIITINKLQENGLIKSTRLLLKYEVPNGYVLRQLGKNNIVQYSGRFSGSESTEVQAVLIRVLVFFTTWINI